MYIRIFYLILPTRPFWHNPTLINPFSFIMHKNLLCFLLAAASVATVSADSFVTTSGTKILDRNGKEITLRGSNCGNWMVQEPYMMNTSGSLDRQFKIHNKLVDIVGREKAEEFDRLWMDCVFGEADLIFMKEQGFNVLRAPMHYKYFTLPVEEEPVAGEQTWLDEGFERIDQIVQWCEKHGMLLILDMHACPGGQSSGDICDYDSSKPSLWESEANRTKLIALWRKIAERYANEKCIAGYDLINETNWTLPNSNKALWDLFKKLIAAVREVDKNHIVIVEGNSYANDYTGFPSANLDSKMIIQYHRYGVYNTTDQLNGMKANGDSHKCPIYIGEFGENSNTWDADAVRAMETGCGFAAWTQWPLKKSNVNTILRVNRVKAYDDVITKLQAGQNPGAETVWNAFKAWAEAQRFENCTVATDYVDALLRRPFDLSALPYHNDNSIDNTIFAAHYDLGAMGHAYYDTGDASYQYNGEDFTNWNDGWIYRNDGVGIEGISGSETLSCGYNVGWTADGEWLQYTVENPHEAAKWDLELRYANSGKVSVTVDGREIAPSTNLASTGGYQTWKTHTFTDVILPQGTLKVRLHIDRGGCNLNYLRFTNRRDASAEELAVLTPASGANILKGADCAHSDFWFHADSGSPHSMLLQWNATDNLPVLASGGVLKVTSKRSGSNIVVYQPVDVIAGHTYKCDVAFRGDANNKDFWVQAFVSENEPVHYADLYLSEDQTIGQLNSWVNSAVINHNGAMSLKATAGKNHKDGVMTWKAPSSGRYYFAIKVGTQHHPFKASFDNFVMRDVDYSGIENVGTDAAPAPYTITGRNLELNGDARVFDLQGRERRPGTMAPGVYVITSAGRAYKIAIR